MKHALPGQRALVDLLLGRVMPARLVHGAQARRRRARPRSPCPRRSGRLHGGRSESSSSSVVERPRHLERLLQRLAALVELGAAVDLHAPGRDVQRGGRSPRAAAVHLGAAFHRQRESGAPVHHAVLAEQDYFAVSVSHRARAGLAASANMRAPAAYAAQRVEGKLRASCTKRRVPSSRRRSVGPLARHRRLRRRVASTAARAPAALEQLLAARDRRVARVGLAQHRCESARTPLAEALLRLPRSAPCACRPAGRCPPACRSSRAHRRCRGCRRAPGRPAPRGRRSARAPRAAWGWRRRSPRRARAVPSRCSCRS